MKSWICTYTGKKFDILNPTAESIDIVDIAHALSMTCRYAGHCKNFYSVAEHSVILSRHFSAKEDAKILLMHDATEAYLTDIPRPIKHLPEFAWYRELEDKLYAIIMEKFGLPKIFSDHLKYFDTGMIHNEIPELFSRLPSEWKDLRPILSCVKFNWWTPEQAKSAFLERFIELWDVVT